MGLQDFAQLLVVGSAVSLAIEFIKAKFGDYTYSARLLTLGLAVVVGVAYVLLRDTSYWQTITQIFVTASAFYALFLKK